MDNENKGYEPEMNQDADIYEDIADKPEENAEALSSEQTEAENAGELGSEQTEVLEDTAEPQVRRRLSTLYKRADTPQAPPLKHIRLKRQRRKSAALPHGWQSAWYACSLPRHA